MALGIVAARITAGVFLPIGVVLFWCC